MIDTHSHVNFNAFKDDALEVIQKALDKGIAVINVGSQLSTSRRAIEIADMYPKVYAAIGLHPIQLQDMEVVEEGLSFVTRAEEFNYSVYRELAGKDFVVAIGETGLDYFHINQKSDRSEVIEKQKKVFNEHINLANEFKLPMIVHTRGSKENPDLAYHDILSELKKNPPKFAGVMHCYVGPVDLIPEFMDLGLYISFNGILTFDKTGKNEQILLNTPEDRILAETDCPYLTPEPYRGKRNEPSYVEFVIQKMAVVKSRSFEDMDQITTRNAERLFKIATQ